VLRSRIVDCAAPARERQQQRELLVGQDHRVLAARDPLGCRIEQHGAETIDFAGRRPIRRPSPQQCLYPGEEFQQAERLRHEVVGTHPEPAHLVRLLALRRQDEDGRAVAFVTQRPQHTVAVHARHHEVEDDEIGARHARIAQSGKAVLGDSDVVAFYL
jgi:hypothetical protein